MQVYDKIFENLYLRKAYHFVGGMLLLIGLVELDAWFFIVGVVYLIVFWAVGKRISFAMLGILFLAAITGSKFTTVGAMIVFWIGDGFGAGARMEGICRCKMILRRWRFGIRRCRRGSFRHCRVRMSLR